MRISFLTHKQSRAIIAKSKSFYSTVWLDTQEMSIIYNFLHGKNLLCSTRCVMTSCCSMHTLHSYIYMFVYVILKTRHAQVVCHKKIVLKKICLVDLHTVQSVHRQAIIYCYVYSRSTIVFML